MGIYRRKYTVTAEDCRADGEMNMSALMRFFQQCAEADSFKPEEGNAWVIVQADCTVKYLPKVGETVIAETWSGKRRHVFYPRYYRLLNEAGDKIVEETANWVMIDTLERKLITENLRECENMTVTGNEIILPAAPKRMKTSPAGFFTVPKEYIDKNGHMNNARYFELVESLTERISGKRHVIIEYDAEALMGDVIELFIGTETGAFYVDGKLGAKNCFRCRVEY